MISTLLTLFLMGLVGLVILAIIGTVLGIAVGLATFLLFKVAPIVLIGYLVLRFLAPRPKQLSAEDRKWLES
jgi:hypothetical protein